MQSGVPSFWRRSKNFALHLVHYILNVTYTLDVNLHILVYPEVSEQPQPSSSPLPICPLPIPHPFHCQGPSATLDTIVPPGVPFKLSCHICQHSLEQGQICHHLDPHTTIVRWDQTEPLQIHQELPFVFCHHLPNLDDPTYTILLQCSINLKIRNDSNDKNIPPLTPPRTNSPNAYHSTFDTQESSSSREQSVFPSRDL